MAATWSDFYPYVQPMVRGASQPLIDQALREAAREFCTRTLVWQDSTKTISVIADQTPAVYTVPASSGTDVVQVLKVASSTRTLAPTTKIIMDMATGWEATTAEEATTFVVPNPNQIELYPIPTTSYTLTLRVAYRPAIDATGVEDFIFQNYRDVITGGALASLYSMPGQTWENQLEAARLRMEFIGNWGAARGSVNRGFQYGVLRAVPVRFLRT